MLCVEPVLQVGTDGHLLSSLKEVAVPLAWGGERIKTPAAHNAQHVYAATSIARATCDLHDCQAVKTHRMTNRYVPAMCA